MSMGDHANTIREALAALVAERKARSFLASNADVDAARHALAALESRLARTEEALRLVEAWIRRGEGSESEAVEAMDACLAASTPGREG